MQRKTNNKKPGRESVGRPAAAGSLDNYQLRLSDEDRAAWSECASRAGLTLAHWIRLVCTWAAGGSAKIVRAEFTVTYPPGTSIGEADVPSGHPIAAIRDALDAGVDVRAAIDELLADESLAGQLVAAELKRRIDDNRKSS